MPRELRDEKMQILCNDCLAKCVVPLHILGGKCQTCNSYNTTRIENFSDLDTSSPHVNHEILTPTGFDDKE